MRNREQIYGQEAAELLRNITVYHCMRRDQLLRLYSGKEGVIENLLRYLVRQQRIFYNTDRDCYGDVPDCREDKELTAALWVLLGFIEKVEYHSPDNMPAKLVFFADGEVYEVAYVGPGMIRTARRHESLTRGTVNRSRPIVVGTRCLPIHICRRKSPYLVSDSAHRTSTMQIFCVISSPRQ